MNIVICNLGYSGYAVACWRELASRPEVNLSVYTPETSYAYDAAILGGLPVTVLPGGVNADELAGKISKASPDVLFISGWSDRLFRKLAYAPGLKTVRKILLVDTMWHGSLRQIGARWALAPYVKHFDGILVPGERGRQFALWAGFRRDRIFTSTYGYDAKMFESCYKKRMEGEWPPSFCFVGRYAPIKGLGTLMAAYRRYREEIHDSPWRLHCYGNGELQGIIGQTEGMVDHGFVQPRDLPSALASHGVFVFPSLHEPWGVALAEAAGSGLPLLCSDQCASGVDLVRHMYNGYVFPAGDAGRLANGLIWMHRHYPRLPQMGLSSKTYAGAYAPCAWADRILDICKSI